MSSTNPCSELRSRADNLANQMRNAASSITGPLAAAKKAAHDALLKNEDYNAIKGEIDSAVGAASSDYGFLSRQAKQMTGSCLSSLLKSLRELLGDSTGILSSIFNAVDSALLALYRMLKSLINIINASGISKLIAMIDELLGCMASSCIGHEIDDLMMEVNSVISLTGLNSRGVFDPTEWITNELGNAGTNILDSVNDIGDTLESLISEVQSDAASIINNTKIPKDFF